MPSADFLSEAALSIPQIFQNRAFCFGSKRALHYKTSNQYRSISWSQWREQVIRCALGLYALGIRKGDRVALLSENRPEWTYIDLGALSIGAIVVPIYPTLTSKEISFILNDSGAKVIVVSNDAQLSKVLSLEEFSHKIIRIIIDSKEGVGEKSLNDLLELGRIYSLNTPDIYERLLNGVDAKQTATIIYTSGTTGPPKGVMLSHQNFVQNYIGAREVIHVGQEDIALSFLPLSHVFERLAGYYFMAFCGAEIAYAENMQTVPENMLEVRPTVCAAVPRFYEKAYARIQERLGSVSPFLKKVLSLEMAKPIICKNVKKGFGGRLRFFISGGAPLNKDLAEFFYRSGVLILEGYGLTETSPVISVNSEKNYRFGSVGKVLSNVEVKIGEQGEILTKGPCVMQGYFNNPNATQEAVKDGWFHTGDVGKIDEQGYLFITDRIKDIIVTSGGKNVSPQNIEKMICEDKLFLQVVIIGDKRNYLVALIVPDKNGIAEMGRLLGLSNLSYDQLMVHPKIYSEVEARLKVKTKELSNYEQIKYFRLLPREFTMESGELTPTLKIKRKIVMERYRSQIDSMYSMTQPPASSK